MEHVAKTSQWNIFPFTTKKKKNQLFVCAKLHVLWNSIDDVFVALTSEHNCEEWRLFNGLNIASLKAVL